MTTDHPRSGNSAWKPAALVFGTSGVVLTLETIAGRLMAPYVGVSQITFTGIIGTVLAGIALGAALGGALADRYDPRKLISTTLIFGGALTWASIPLVRIFGPTFGGIDGPIGIVLLTAVAFLLPCTVLSSISPMVAKMRLESLDETGAIVGRISAAGTFGALAGTFLTGFVLIAALPSQWVVVGIGAITIVAGIVYGATNTSLDRSMSTWVLVAAAGAGATVLGPPYDIETAYACVRVEHDPQRRSGRNLILDRTRHAYVDLEDPTLLDMRYAQLVARVIDQQPEGPLDVVHIGGGGFSMPMWLDAVRPGSASVVLEIDRVLVDIAAEQLGFDSPNTEVIIGDARMTLRRVPDASADVVIGDAFASASVPWHLTTAEAVADIERVLRPGGTYVMNVIDGGDNRFARAQLATLAEQFDHVAAILLTNAGPADGPVNQILIASDATIDPPDLDGLDGEFVTGTQLDAFIGDAAVLTDAFAPVDQLVMG